MELAESFYKAIPAGTPFYSAALCGVGAIYLSRRKWDQALKNFRAAIDVDTSSPTASLYSAIALRQSGKKEKAYRLLKEATNKDPLNHIICREMSLTAPDQNEVFLYKEKLTQMLNDDKQFYIDLACFYIGLGMFEDSRLILLEAAQVWDYPILSYFLSHLFGRLGEPLEAEKWLRKAFQSNPENVFPNRLEEIKLLSNILQTKPDDAKAKYYLGNFLYAHQRYNEAIELWELALEGLKQFDVIYHNLGLAQWKKCNNPSLAMEYFEEALRLNPQNQDLYLYLDNIYSEQKQEDKRHALLEKMKQLPEPRHDVQKRIVTVLVDLDCFQEAIQRLTSEKFMPLEMDQSFRHSYVRAYLKRAQFFMKEGQVEEAIADYKHAMEYPKNVGVGKPVVGTNAEVLYYLGCAYEILRQIDNAISVWREAAKENHQQGSDLYPFILKSLDKLNIYTELGYC